MSLDTRNVRKRRSSRFLGAINLPQEDDGQSSVYTTSTLAALLGIKRNTVVKWILSGKIPAKKIGGVWVITEGVAHSVAKWWSREKATN